MIEGAFLDHSEINEGRAHTGIVGSSGDEHGEYVAAERKATQIALDAIRARFEGGTVPDHMYYHNSAHTAGVIARARAIGVAMGMSARELLLTVIAAAFHDIVQQWSPAREDDGSVIRQRHAGRNEVASAHEAVEAMAQLGPAFTSDEQGIVASAIIGTIPAWDNELATVVQPFLVAHPVVRALALADIGSAGMDPEMYRLDGPALFAEENLDVMAALVKARRADDIPDADQRAYRERFGGWLKVQAVFARGRRESLESGELDGLEEPARGRVIQLFSRFDESIEHAERAAAEAETLDFVQLMRQLDPRLFPEEP